MFYINITKFLTNKNNKEKETHIVTFILLPYHSYWTAIVSRLVKLFPQPWVVIIKPNE